ncbi:IclR family transcriptional regulator [Haloferax sp. KTX1]|uniref:IclR family transcriptional regulator n=1 Tax=Haloferax sp. KTX1 TaxID=2600597 RepID=UPI0021036C1C|nr:IclR family transcriptional regulator [Haloferax sp. KTX1]
MPETVTESADDFSNRRSTTTNDYRLGNTLGAGRGRSHMTEKATRPIRSDETLLAILEALEERTAPSVSDVATHAGVSKSTAHNHLSTLREHGYVVDGDRGYELSLRFLELGESARTNTEIYEVARPHADDISRETRLLVNISVEDRGKGVYLYRTRGDDRIRLSTRAGEVHELHCTATGKALLAHLPERRVESILDRHGLPKRSENTITDRETLRTELAEIRERGYSVDDEEYGQGLRCVGVPVLNGDDAVIGALSASGPATEVVGERLTTELPTHLKRVRNRIELNLRDY